MKRTGLLIALAIALFGGAYGNGQKVVAAEQKEEIQVESLGEDKGTEALNVQSKDDILDKAKAFADSNDYISAIALLNAAESVFGKDTELTEKKEEYEELYISSILEKNDTVNSDNEDDSDPNIFLKAYQSKGNYKEYSAKESKNSESFTMAGQEYFDGFTFKCKVYQGGIWSVYYLEGRYSRLQFTLCHVDGTDVGEKNTFKIICDDVVTEEIEVSADMAPKQITLDVSGVEQLKFQMGDDRAGEPVYGVGNPILFPAETVQNEWDNTNKE